MEENEIEMYDGIRGYAVHISKAAVKVKEHNTHFAAVRILS